MNSKKQKLDSIGVLLDIMDNLRAKCPWDKKQTFDSLRHLTIEETYELGDAIVAGDLLEVKKELGDLLLHIIFYAKLGSEVDAFDIADIAQYISEKLIFRHPHIYGNVTVKDDEEVKKNWENLKLKEGKKTVLDGVPKGLPSLVKAQRIQDKASGVGFDWKNSEQVWSKVEEEIIEFRKEVSLGNLKKSEDELGDVLFSLINYARFLEINPDTALERSNQKFIRRFNFLEARSKELRVPLDKMSIQEMQIIWEKAKNQVHPSEDS